MTVLHETHCEPSTVDYLQIPYMRVPYITVDVFTDRMFGGNQLAVFPDARAIDPALMQPIAQEFNFSETTYVLPPDNPAHTARVRIFTPGSELPFAGHPTVGTAHVLASTGAIKLTGDLTRIVFEEIAGPVPVTIRMKNGTVEFCQLTAAKPPETVGEPPSRERLAAALSLPVDALRSGGWSPEIVTCGTPFLFVPLRDRAAVAAARAKLDVWDEVIDSRLGIWEPAIHGLPGPFGGWSSRDSKWGARRFSRSRPTRRAAGSSGRVSADRR
jgi:trans-2,3-dihydro-3-hydroxyanthranilate isomerase